MIPASRAIVMTIPIMGAAKPLEVLPDVRKAVKDAVSGLTVEQPACNF
jgi:hypothetical protein